MVWQQEKGNDRQTRTDKLMTCFALEPTHHHSEPEHTNGTSILGGLIGFGWHLFPLLVAVFVKFYPLHIYIVLSMCWCNVSAVPISWLNRLDFQYDRQIFIMMIRVMTVCVQTHHFLLYLICLLTSIVSI